MNVKVKSFLNRSNFYANKKRGCWYEPHNLLFHYRNID
jgi:hypothetical protein